MSFKGFKNINRNIEFNISNFFLFSISIHSSERNSCKETDNGYVQNVTYLD